MTISPVHNLRMFASSKPPLVVFMACMGLCAVLLLSLSYWVRVRQLPDTNVETDWNMFLENLADLDFCIAENTSDSNAWPLGSSLTNDKVTPVPKISSVSPIADASYEPAVVDYMRNYSVSMLLAVRPTKQFLSIRHNITHLSGQLLGSDIGLRGFAAQEVLNFTVILPYDWNATRCNRDVCDVVHIYACVFLYGSALAFPHSRSPDRCESVNQTGVEYHARVRTAQSGDFDEWQICGTKPYVKMAYNLDPKLTVYLNMHNNSVINLHLMHTSYFLFVMFITLFCYALLKTRSGHARAAKVSLLDKAHASDI